MGEEGMACERGGGHERRKTPSTTAARMGVVDGDSDGEVLVLGHAASVEVARGLNVAVGTE